MAYADTFSARAAATIIAAIPGDVPNLIAAELPTALTTEASLTERVPNRPSSGRLARDLAR